MEPAMARPQVCRRPRFADSSRSTFAFIDPRAPGTSASSPETVNTPYLLRHEDMVVPVSSRYVVSNMVAASISLPEREAVISAAQRAADEQTDGGIVGGISPRAGAATAGQDTSSGVRFGNEGGHIAIQDKFGLLLSFCSLLVSVQVLIPRVL